MLSKEILIERTEQGEFQAKQTAEAYRDLGALTYIEAKNMVDYYQAIHAYKRATQLDPDNVDAWNQLGHIFRRIGNLDNAIHAFEQVLKLCDFEQDLKGDAYNDQKMLAMAYDNLGNVYEIKGDLDKAIEFYQKSLEITEALGIKETSANNYGNLGSVHKKKGDKAAARGYWEKSVELYRQLGSPMEQTVQSWIVAL